ncbi:DUF3370 family protein [Calothrix sp. PCC 6303]|uniref:DUF3370 family protein n=1 Tax=Calothrix sp. PCC 6303 TaxID=1170562 RepID=UPI0002A01D36|nr:DUF3370 family protein [Calothrix sp. PCC 6303]AFZ01377.1 S-layer domain-containing protein [Calothrix sp. PCC 6303]
MPSLLRLLTLSSIIVIFPNTTALAFNDTQEYWGNNCIRELNSRKLITGYPDNTFRPNLTVTRAEAAVLMLNAFPDTPNKRNSTPFRDVPPTHWANKAISTAYQKGFFSGYPGRIFQPNQAIPRAQIIGVITGAKNYNSISNPAQTLQKYFLDAAEIPGYAQNAIASAAINSIIVNYPNIKQLKPNQSATRGEVAALMCRALNIYTIPPQYIAGVEVKPQQVKPLPGKLDTIPTFNSNSPELVESDGILLSTFPPSGKKTPAAHLNYPFQGRFDIFSHHIVRAETAARNRTVYQGIIVHNPGNQPVTLEILNGASYLTQQAPFIPLPDIQNNSQNTVYSGPGSRTMGDVLQGMRQNIFPEKIVIEPGKSQILANLPIPVLAPSSNGRTTMMRLQSDGVIYIANLAMTANRLPTLPEWQNLLNNGNLAEKRDAIPTPLEPPREPTVFGRVAGVSQGAKWEGVITDNSEATKLTIPESGTAISYPLGTVHLVTLATKQIQSAKMLARYPDTAYFAHSNYGVEYDLTLPLHNPTNQTKTVNILIQTPLKDEGGTDRLLFLNPQVEQIFFRGTVKVSYEDDLGKMQVKYLHVVQRRGQQGKALVTLQLAAGATKKVEVDFIYPPDSTPPQVLTVETAR